MRVSSSRVAVVGCGRMGRIHATKLQQRDDVDLVVVDPAGVPEGFSRAERVPDDLDAAVIAVPAGLHARVAGPLLQRGVACLIEKPLALGLDVRALEGFERLTVGHVERFNPALGALPSSIAPRYIRAERLGRPGRAVDVDVVLDLMIHDLDLVLHLGGPVRELRAVGLDVQGAGIDIAEVWLETEAGCVATLTASRVSHRAQRTLRVVDEAAYWSLDLAAGRAGRVPWSDGDLTPHAVDVPVADAIESMHDAFLSAVQGRQPFPVPAREGAAAVRLAERVVEAIEVR